MPCFDKKLEASRSDFHLNEPETREVDCVITSGTAAAFVLFSKSNFSFFNVHVFNAGEVQLMLEEKNVSLSDVEPAPLDTVYVCRLLRLPPGVNRLTVVFSSLLQVQQRERWPVPAPCWEQLRGLPPSRLYLCCQASVWRRSERAHLQDPKVSELAAEYLDCEGCIY